MAVIDKTELTQSVLGLQFWVDSQHFQAGKLKVKCRGQIPSVYNQESDTFVVGEHDGPQHKVLQATSLANRGKFLWFLTRSFCFLGIFLKANKKAVLL